MRDLSEFLDDTFKNKPKAAGERLRALVKLMKRGDRLLVHSPIPATLERWIKKQAEKRKFNVTFCGQTYQTTFQSKEEIQAQEEARRKREEERGRYD